VAAGTNSQTNSLQFFDNDGEGRLTTGVFRVFGCTGPLRRGIVAGDLNRDAAVDIATGCGYHVLRNGDAWTEIPSPLIESLAGGDVTGDGALDLVSPGGAVLVNQGNGEVVMMRSAGPERYRGVAVADLDGNGAEDIITGNTMRGSAEIHWNAGGAFEPAVQLGLDGQPWAVAAGDLNGDALADLVVTVFGATGHPYAVVRVLTNLGNRRFSAPQTLDSDAYCAELVLTDVNGDGIADIVAGNQGGGSGGPVSLWLNASP
jgi:hypothetical protein